MKRIIAFILLAVSLLSVLAPAVYAEEDAAETTAATEAAEATQPQEKKTEGWMDGDFYWELKDGVLTITGEGVMPGNTPWREYAQQIDKLVFEGNIYTVAAAAFANCHALREIQFPSGITEIGDYAFQGCTNLKEIRLPQGFKKFGVSCFGGCTALTQVYCDGYMPRFNENCLWNGERIYIYYHPDRVWNVEDVKVLERNFGGRLEVLSQDGTDPIPNGEEEPAPPAPVAQTEPPETEPETVPTTVATEPPVVTEPIFIDVETQPAVTVMETEPQTLATEETFPWAATEPETVEEEAIRGGFIGLALILGVLTFFIVGALIFKLRSRRGRY